MTTNVQKPPNKLFNAPAATFLRTLLWPRDHPRPSPLAADNNYGATIGPIKLTSLLVLAHSLAQYQTVDCIKRRLIR